MIENARPLSFPAIAYCCVCTHYTCAECGWMDHSPLGCADYANYLELLRINFSSMPKHLPSSRPWNVRFPYHSLERMGAEVRPHNRIPENNEKYWCDCCGVGLVVPDNLPCDMSVSRLAACVRHHAVLRNFKNVSCSSSPGSRERLRTKLEEAAHRMQCIEFRNQARLKRYVKGEQTPKRKKELVRVRNEKLV